MAEVVASEPVPGPASEVLALWDDPARWPAFVEGFRAVVRQDPQWPEPGAKLTWDTGPHGQGRTIERVLEPGVRKIETAQLKGTLSASYDDGQFILSLEYELKERTVYTFFFVRRALKASLYRTISRFAIERRADAELE